MKKHILILAGLALAAAGCADTRQGRLEMDYGTSQRLAVFNQALDPGAERNLDPVTGLDGQAGAEVMKKYRESFEVEKHPSTININVGL